MAFLLNLFLQFLQYCLKHVPAAIFIYYRLNFPSYYTEELYVICYLHLETPLWSLLTNILIS